MSDVDALPNQRQSNGPRRGRGRGRGPRPQGEPTFSKTVVVVKGLPLEQEEGPIREVLGSKGAIESVEKRETRKGDTSYFVVTFATEDAAAASLALDGTDFNGTKLSVEAKRMPPARTPRAPASEEPKKGKVVEVPADPTHIFVGGLRRAVGADDLRNIFSAYGTITNVDVARNKTFAIVAFETEAAAQAALAADEQTVNEQVIRVRPEEARTRRVRERAPRRKLNPTKVFMGGVPKDCELSVLQAKFPGIVDGSVRNQVAFVDFDTPENAEAAVAMHDQAVFGEDNVRIELARKPRTPGAPRAE